MTVQGPGPIELQQGGIQPAMNLDKRQLRRLDAGSDRFGITQREQQHRLAGLLQTLDRDDRILAAANRNACPCGQIEGDGWGDRRRFRAKAEMVVQRNAVSECELRETL